MWLFSSRIYEFGSKMMEVASAKRITEATLDSASSLTRTRNNTRTAPRAVRGHWLPESGRNRECFFFHASLVQGQEDYSLRLFLVSRMHLS
jgi:hypothetical protein